MNEQLIPARTVEDLAAAIRVHILTCERDHMGAFSQIPLILFNPGLSTLTCKVCGNSEQLRKPPVDGGKLETYLCHLLRQQSQMFTLHFATCAETKGNA